MAKFMQNLPGLESSNVDDSSNLDRRWELCRAEIELFLQASGVTKDDKKRAILLHTSGKRVREIFATLHQGTSYAEACKTITYKPKKKYIYERWLFQNVRQTCDETTSAFIVRLHKLAETCEYYIWVVTKFILLLIQHNSRAWADWKIYQKNFLNQG